LILLIGFGLSEFKLANVRVKPVDGCKLLQTENSNDLKPALIDHSQKIFPANQTNDGITFD
jgi:hypothetical protein